VTPSETRAGRCVADVLDDYGKVTREALVRWLPRQEPREYLYDLVADYPSRGGRMLRPSLCIATARVFGASVEDALPAAICIELLHNALLIHDDIEDESDERRGRPTLHQLAGTPLAINAGDSLAMLSLRPLLEARERLGALVVIRMLEEFDRMAHESAEGQALDLGWRRDNVIDLRESDYLTMVLKKTCWLATLFPIRLGALIGTRDQVDLDRFLRFGFFLGAAFQIQDDLLNLVGDHARYGKELSGDLYEGKRTLMMIHLLEHVSEEDRERIRSILATPREQRSVASVEWLRKSMDAAGSIQHARELAHGLAGAAMHEFEQLFGEYPESRERRFLESLPVWVLERT
jgi:geranylgeranyl diphosphate synthase type II